MAPPTWQAALLEPRTYPHPVRDLKLVETHISIVALTGDLAYKLKKPVNFGFLDFSTLARRRHLCAEEVRLNRRTAPEIYLGTVSLRRHGEGYAFAGDGEVVEEAVQMRQFPEADRFDRLAHSGGLKPAWIEELAQELASLHTSAAARTAAGLEPHATRLQRIFLQNSRQLPDSECERRLRTSFLQRWQANLELLRAREVSQVRDCHGDLHLGNVCLWQGRPRLFDCIEFSEDLRVIDVLSDAAFLYMDLLAIGQGSLAHLFLGLYLEATGDYAGLPLLPLLVAYRAHVRAMVTELTPAHGTEATTARELRRDGYLHLAQSQLDRPAGGITILSGLPGSGKSTVALELATARGGVRIRSDVERKRLQSHEPGLALYAPETSRRVYDLLLAQAQATCAGGLPAVLDATFSGRSERLRARQLAQSLQVPFQIVHCVAPLAELERRVRARRAQGADASDADVDVVHELASRWESFSAEEEPFVMAAERARAAPAPQLIPG